MISAVKKSIFALHIKTGAEKSIEKALKILLPLEFTEEELKALAFEIQNLNQNVTKINNSGKIAKVKENIVPGYMFVKFNPDFFGRVYVLLKQKVFGVINVLGEVSGLELAHLFDQANIDTVEIEVPEVSNEGELRRLDHILSGKSKKYKKVIANRKVRDLIMERIAFLKEQKRRYSSYLRNFTMLKDYLVQKGKKAVFQLPIFNKIREYLRTLLFQFLVGNPNYC